MTRSRVYRGIDLSSLISPAFIERFWAKVDTSEDGCWLWIAHCKKPHGYGQFTLRKGVFVSAHAISYALANGGQVPPGMHVCHHCDNPPCVRPTHLFLGTARDNGLDSVRKGRAHRAIGEANASARLTEADVRAIRSAGHSAGSLKTIGAQYGISDTAVRRVLIRQTWRHVS